MDKYKTRSIIRDLKNSQEEFLSTKDVNKLLSLLESLVATVSDLEDRIYTLERKS